MIFFCDQSPFTYTPHHSHCCFFKVFNALVSRTAPNLRQSFSWNKMEFSAFNTIETPSYGDNAIIKAFNLWDEIPFSLRSNLIFKIRLFFILYVGLFCYSFTNSLIYKSIWLKYEQLEKVTTGTIIHWLILWSWLTSTNANGHIFISGNVKSIIHHPGYLFVPP